jgi:hypothetical protein
MSTRYSVTALDRSGIGHPNCHRAHRSWPSGKEIIIEALDQDEDPLLKSVDNEGVTHFYPDPARLGRTSLAQIKADKILVVRPLGANLEEAEALQDQIAELQSALSAMTTRADLAEKEIVRLNSELARSREEASELALSRAESSIEAELLAKISTLEAELDAATAPAAPKPVSMSKKLSEHKKA